MWFWCGSQGSLWVLWGLWLDMGLWFEIFEVKAFVLGLWWCVTGFLPIGWSHEEPFMGFETFDLIDIYVTIYYFVNLQPLFHFFFFTYSLHYSFCIFLLILDNSLFVFFYFYFDTNVLYCTRINEIIFPLLVWTIWIVFKIMNEVYNLIDLR